MALNVVYGKAGSGKSTYLFDYIKSNLNKDKELKQKDITIESKQNTIDVLKQENKDLKSGKTYKEQIKLDKDKRYLVLYVDKCRNGQDGIYILYQFNGQTATYYEIGYCTVHPDSQRN